MGEPKKKKKRSKSEKKERHDEVKEISFHSSFLEKISIEHPSAGSFSGDSTSPERTVDQTAQASFEGKESGFVTNDNPRDQEKQERVSIKTTKLEIFVFDDGSQEALSTLEENC